MSSHFWVSYGKAYNLSKNWDNELLLKIKLVPNILIQKPKDSIYVELSTKKLKQLFDKLNQVAK